MTKHLTKADWHLHPNFPNQALLLGSHANFLRFSQALIRLGRTEGIPSDEILWPFQRWIGAMRSHERYEEHKLYPYLQQRCELELKPLTAGHAQLHGLADEVELALGASPVAGASAVAALVAHHEALERHLDLEEAAVIPLLLELPPAVFERYARSTIGALLADNAG